MTAIKLETAIAIAATQHAGQKDKAGQPYILHVLRVMLDPSLTTEEERIVAVFHDMKEDCGVTDNDLRGWGCSEATVEALDYLTKRPEEEDDYGAFIERIRKGPELARKVKLSDLRKNSDLSRIENPNAHDYKRLAKYEWAIKVLEEVAA